MSSGWSLLRSFVQFFNIEPFSCLELTEILSSLGLAPLEPNLIAFVMVAGVPIYFWISFEEAQTRWH